MNVFTLKSFKWSYNEEEYGEEEEDKFLKSSCWNWQRKLDVFKVNTVDLQK